MIPYLAADHVRKSYRTEQVLKDVWLQVYQGETLALLGPNGAGKTTFIKILATLLRKDGGQVRILGYDLDSHSEEIRHLIGYVGQDTERSAYARLTVAENLRFFGRLRGMSKRQIEQQTEKLAAYFDFQSRLDTQFVQLSGGQKQTVVIMRALLHDPPLVYLDEPTKGLDPIIAQKIRVFLKQFVQQEHKALLLTSHILTEVDEMADRVALIHDGAIPVCDTSDALKSAVGATDLVELEHAALPAHVRAEILKLDAVRHQVERRNGWASFGVTDLVAGAEGILRILRHHNIHTDFRHHTVTLEDAFVHHIGKLGERFE
jgi:ABC-2 type transport system ATP-binding protein